MISYVTKLIWDLSKRSTIMKRKCFYFATLLCLAVMFLLPSFALAAPQGGNPVQPGSRPVARGTVKPANRPAANTNLIVFNDTLRGLPLMSINLSDWPWVYSYYSALPGYYGWSFIWP